MEQTAQKVLGTQKYCLWEKVSALVEGLYDMEILLGLGGKKWDVEKKYRRGGKTLCCLYARAHTLGFMVILGKEEQAKFAAENWSTPVQRVFDEAKAYHDGKWLMLELEDESLFADIERLLRIKRKPNKKEMF